MNSIIDGNAKGKCYICGRYCRTEEHHIFGAALRKKSEKYGLKVDLCHSCHNEPPNGAHFSRSVNTALKKQAQIEAMRKYGWTVEQFTKEFYKNYLEG